MVNFVHLVKVPFCGLEIQGKVLCQGLVYSRATAAAMTNALRIMSANPFSSSASSDPYGVAGVSSVVSAASLSSSTPWLMLSQEIDEATGGKVERFYSPLHKQICKIHRRSLRVPEDALCIASSRRWLGFIDPTSCSLYLSNTFHLSQSWISHICGRVWQLPSIETLPSVMGITRKPSSKILVDSFLITDFNHDDNAKRYASWTPEMVSSRFIKQLALSIDPISSLTRRWKEASCIVMLSQTQTSQLAFCRLGKEQFWNPLPGSSSCGDQIVYSHREKLFYNTFYDMFGNLGIEAWDIPANPSRPPTRAAGFIIEHHIITRTDEFNKSKRYLVVDESSSEDHIMIVDRHMITNSPSLSQTLSFDVYKLDMSKRRMRNVKCLGDQALFLGLNHSFCLSASEFPGLKPNSVYFTDDDFWGECLGQDTGIYNLEDNSITPCYPFMDDLKEGKFIPSPPFWVAPTRSC